MPDVEQPLLTQHEEEEVRQGGFEPALPAGRAIAPVSIPRKSLGDDYEHHEHHAHSPMAYSAVGSFAARLVTKLPCTVSQGCQAV